MNNIQKAYLPKTSITGQIVSEISAKLCSNDSKQIPLNLTKFSTLWIKASLEGFVWSHQCESQVSELLNFFKKCIPWPTIIK